MNFSTRAKTAVCTARDALLRQGFVRSVGVLAGGTLIAQALMVCVLPLLTRLYTPEDYSLLAVYTSVLGIITVAACLRFEIAIPLPERDTDAVNIFALALFSATCVGGIAALAVWLIPSQIVGLLEQPKLKPYLWLLPIGIWSASSYAALQYWSIRKKKFSTIAKTRFTQAIGGASTQVGLGWGGIAPLGLLLGQLITVSCGIFALTRSMFNYDQTALRAISRRRMHRMFKKYARFPKFSVFESVANSAGIQLPIIMIAALAMKSDAGYLMLATQAMQAPMTLIGSAVGQVYLSQAPDEHRAGNLGVFTGNVIKGLIGSGVGPLLFAGIVAPVVFPLIFGDTWARAGYFVSWMTPWFVMQFLTSPISMSLHVTGNQRIALLLQLGGLAIRIGVVLLAATFDDNRIVEWYAVTGFMFYFAYFFIVARIIGITFEALTKALLTRGQVIIGWLSLAILVLVTLKFLHNL